MFTIKDHLEVQSDQLFIGGADTPELAKQYGIQLYVTNESRLRISLHKEMHFQMLISNTLQRTEEVLTSSGYLQYRF